MSDLSPHYLVDDLSEQLGTDIIVAHRHPALLSVSL